MLNLLFKGNSTFTIGVELELQLINLQNFNLVMEAKDFLRRLSNRSCSGEIKPEITQAMIEINSSVHTTYSDLLFELRTIRNIIADEAYKTHIGVCGGGAHPFQKWQNQRIFHTERFSEVSEQYGYLAKQFTVFGQHIHIGCPNGDDALYLCHALARYLPQFIALSASSPFYQGIDTSFDCSRLTVISAFPLSGTPPWLLTWDEFNIYYEKMLGLGVVKKMKDFYWDIRPKPDYGTVELRICDTPLTIGKAADLAAFAQLLIYWLLEARPVLSREIYLTYLMNRFRASRYGLNAIIVDPIKKLTIPLADDIINTCNILTPFSKIFNSEEALINIKESALAKKNDASWMRAINKKLNSLNDAVRAQTELWLNDTSFIKTY
ncbi:MAG: glutamate--cysteine ligase [Gammaproteobacteria bacterium]|nr:glutamate--cysteine ligase [Gammaproteobacteria bacterium]